MITIKYPATEAVRDFEKKVEKKKQRLISTLPHKRKNRSKRNGLGKY